MEHDVEIASFDPDLADEADLLGCYRVMAGSQVVERPDEPRLTYDDLLARLRNPVPWLGPGRYWVARRHRKVHGVGHTFLPDGENRHLALVEITVHPQHRRRGTGTAMLRTILGQASAGGRRLVEGWQVTRGGAGHRWANALGFRTGSATLLQTLQIARADRRTWRPDIPEGYRVQRWNGATPAELLPSYAAARREIRYAPVGGMSYRPPLWTPELVREREAHLRTGDVQRRAVVAVHEATGTVAGLTELELHPDRPDWGRQRDTVVLPAHRGQGLGRCIKSHMLAWLLADRPKLKLVWTTTSADNVHMIRVNHELGLTTVRTMVVVNQEIAALHRRLVMRRP